MGWCPLGQDGWGGGGKDGLGGPGMESQSPAGPARRRPGFSESSSTRLGQGLVPSHRRREAHRFPLAFTSFPGHDGRRGYQRAR